MPAVIPIESTNTGSPQIYFMDVAEKNHHNPAPNPIIINFHVFLNTWSPYMPFDVSKQIWQDGKSWDELEREAEFLYYRCKMARDGMMEVPSFTNQNSDSFDRLRKKRDEKEVCLCKDVARG